MWYGGICICTNFGISCFFLPFSYGPNVLIQLEDFEKKNGFNLLERYKNDYVVFNDDVQGSCTLLQLTLALQPLFSNNASFILLLNISRQVCLPVVVWCVCSLSALSPFFVNFFNLISFALVFALMPIGIENYLIHLIRGVGWDHFSRLYCCFRLIV